jgi:hypothetical protein
MADYLIAAGLFCAVAALVIIWLDLRGFLSGKGPPSLTEERYDYRLFENPWRKEWRGRKCHRKN